MKCVKIGIKQAEKMKNQLIKIGVLSFDYIVLREKNYVYFPVTKKIKGFDVIEKRLNKREDRVTFEDLLKKKLNKKEFDLVTKSFDVVGDIAIIEIDRELLKKKKVIAEALLKAIKNVKTVIKKAGEHKGEYRIQDYEFLAGEKKFETVHRENGVLLKLDVRKTYYSPRTSNERLRIAKEIKKGEKVLVMFSGIGVYPIVFSKHSLASEIYGVEINPDACKYAEENLKLNKVKNVKLFCGDVNDVVPKLKNKFDRIVMPLPRTSTEFLDLALKYLNKNGIINLYFFSSEDEVDKIINLVKNKCDCEVIRVVKTGQQSPKIHKYCIDLRV